LEYATTRREAATMTNTTGTTSTTSTTTPTTRTPGQTELSRERADLLETLRRHRFFLRFTARDLTDEQAAIRTTVSELTVGGLIKHVAHTEAKWTRFIVEGPDVVALPSDGDFSEWTQEFQILPGETLAGLLAAYDEVAARTDELVATLPSLDDDQPLPEAPWFEPGARWSARRVFLHIVAETAQHAGHADIVRESLDGAKSMG
jgi:Protein of unknown function (DUF664)